MRSRYRSRCFPDFMVAGTLSMQGIIKAQQEAAHLVYLRELRLHDRAVCGVYHRRDGRNQPRAVRPAGSGIGVGGRDSIPSTAASAGRSTSWPNTPTSSVVSSVAVDAILGRMAAPVPNVAWLAFPINVVFPALAVYRSGASCFVLVKKLKDPVQQKTLIGAAILCMGVGLPFLVAPVNTAIIRTVLVHVQGRVIVYIMIWFRGTFPRFRYDQLMNIDGNT